MKPADLKRVREQLGLTQQQMADALRTTRVSVARYEAGMRRIPGMVQVTLDQLGRSSEIPMAGMVAAGSPIEPVPQSELDRCPTQHVAWWKYVCTPRQRGIHER